MKILVTMKRVPDPTAKVKVKDGHIDLTGAAYIPNTFDEYALETALRLCENGDTNTRQAGSEIVLVSLTLLIHPLVILVPTGWSVAAPYGVASMGNAAMHGYSEVLYAFATSAANNGSAFAGLNANTLWYNLATAIVILLGRYPPIIFMMAVAGSLAAKPTVPATRGMLRTDSLKFGIFWLGTILVVGALTFFPALVLGPIAEFFAMKGGLLF